MPASVRDHVRPRQVFHADLPGALLYDFDSRVLGQQLLSKMWLSSTVSALTPRPTSAPGRSALSRAPSSWRARAIRTFPRPSTRRR